MNSDQPVAASNAVSSSTAPRNPLDTLSSADIAVHLASMARMDTTVDVVNNADSVNSQLAIVPSDSQVIAKPQIVNTELKSKNDIQKYTTVEGDTISTVAEKFGVTSDSIRWSNGVNGNALAVDQELFIPPINGIVHKVASGDTPASLAQKYQADEAQIIAYNDAEIDGLVLGEAILIPNGRVQPPPRPVFTSTFSAFRFSPSYSGNGYVRGYCTWHAANRRAEIGRPIPSNLGNAITWHARAAGAGLATGSEPQVGAVVWHANIGGLGHVAFVEAKNEDGSILVSDMNYPSWGRVTTRTVTPSEFGSYRFIY